MNKEELLQELSSKISLGEISTDEVVSRLNLVEPIVSPEKIVETKNSSHFSVTKLLYVLGAIIAIVGMVLFSYQIWDTVGSFGRVSITLGLGFLLTAIGSFLLKKNSTELETGDSLGSVFHFLGGILIPGGAVVALSEFLTGVDLSWPIAFTFGIIFVFYLLINKIHKNPILTFFAIANGTAFVYLAVYAMTDGFISTDLYTYLTMIIGACYVLLAYSFRDGWNNRLVSALYFFGFSGIEFAVFYQYVNTNTWGNQHSMWPVVFSFGLISAFCLFLNFYLKNARLTFLSIFNGTAFVYLFVEALIGGSYYANIDTYVNLTMVMGLVYLLLSYSFRNGFNSVLTRILNFFGSIGLFSAAFSKIYGSLPWQLFFLVLVVGGFVFSVYVRSRIILTISTLFLLSYVSYITSEYFADSLGWPISLVMLGFVFIGLGYMSIKINKKYIM